MSLREEMWKYEQITGESAEHVPIIKLGAFLDGYEMGLKALEQQLRDCNSCKHSDNGKCAYTEECHECMWESKYEQQPCGDCVSREDILDYIAKLLSGYLYEEERERLEDFATYIAEMPSGTPADILDKIRAEIADLQLIGYATVDGKREIASRAVMQIIDKYKTESEE